MASRRCDVAREDTIHRSLAALVQRDDREQEQEAWEEEGVFVGGVQRSSYPAAPFPRKSIALHTRRTRQPVARRREPCEAQEQPRICERARGASRVLPRQRCIRIGQRVHRRSAQRCGRRCDVSGLNAEVQLRQRRGWRLQEVVQAHRPCDQQGEAEDVRPDGRQAVAQPQVRKGEGGGGEEGGEGGLRARPR